MFLLGRAYEANGPQEIGRALELYRSAAADGFIPAMARLAHIYAEGARDVAADQILALRWMKRAAAGTDADAVMQYARFLASSPAAGVRPEDAFVQYLRAARLGSAEAMLQLGRAYLSGTGVSRNDAEGLKWLARAAEAQNSDAMLELYSHAEMNGGAETEEAGKWLARSAALGNLSAMYRLGVSPFVGSAAAISSENALEWLRQAERRGHRPSKRAIAVIIANQTEEEEEVEDE
jgi:TPR repeat protein